MVMGGHGWSWVVRRWDHPSTTHDGSWDHRAAYFPDRGLHSPHSGSARLLCSTRFQLCAITITAPTRRRVDCGARRRWPGSGMGNFSFKLSASRRGLRWWAWFVIDFLRASKRAACINNVAVGGGPRWLAAVGCMPCCSCLWSRQDMVCGHRAKIPGQCRVRGDVQHAPPRRGLHCAAYRRHDFVLVVRPHSACESPLTTDDGCHTEPMPAAFAVDRKRPRRGLNRAAQVAQDIVLVGQRLCTRIHHANWLGPPMTTHDHR